MRKRLQFEFLKGYLGGVVKETKKKIGARENVN